MKLQKRIRNTLSEKHDPAGAIEKIFKDATREVPGLKFDELLGMQPFFLKDPLRDRGAHKSKPD